MEEKELASTPASERKRPPRAGRRQKAIHPYATQPRDRQSGAEESGTAKTVQEKTQALSTHSRTTIP